MRLSRTLTAAAILVSLAATPALPSGAESGAVATVRTPDDPTGLISSDNLALVTALPEPAVIGARFRGKHMFVTASSGLAVYDVSVPTAPVAVGRLPLPHFENEDVDLGGDILLIANDSAESYGMLYVIDIRNPAAPTLRSTLDLGTINPMTGGGSGHTVSCISDCRFAWVTGSGGYDVIDLRNPDVPKKVGTQPTPASGTLGITHDVQMDENGIAWTVGFGGTAGFVVPADYAGERLNPLVTTDASGASGYDKTFGLDDGSGPNDYIHHNSRRLKDSDVVYVTEEDYNRPGCRGAGAFERWNLPMRDVEDAEGNVTREITGEKMTLKDMWVTELLADTASPAALCSAHYFDVRGGLVAQGWYEQGLRLLDVSGDTIRQIGFWVPPTAMTWSSYFPPTDPTGTVIYVLDATHGIDVLKLTLPAGGVADAPTLVAPVREMWRVGSPLGTPGRFGYACRLL